MATQAGEIFCFRREINSRTLRELLKVGLSWIYKVEFERSSNKMGGLGVSN